MKSILIALTMILSASAFAQDMSRTEKYENAYREMEDGSNKYVGGCSVHQDYEGELFNVTSVVVEGYEPEYQAPVSQTMKKLKHVEVELLDAVAAGADGDTAEFFAGVDDFTLERIKSTKFKGLDLYRWNIGVGGGNGYYEVYNRTVVKGKPNYKKLSNVFDGDLEFCDKSVWIKK